MKVLTPFFKIGQLKPFSEKIVPLQLQNTIDSCANVQSLRLRERSQVFVFSKELSDARFFLDGLTGKDWNALFSQLHKAEDRHLFVALLYMIKLNLKTIVCWGELDIEITNKIPDGQNPPSNEEERTVFYRESESCFVTEYLSLQQILDIINESYAYNMKYVADIPVNGPEPEEVEFKFSFDGFPANPKKLFERTPREKQWHMVITMDEVKKYFNLID